VLNLSCFGPDNKTPLNIYLSELNFVKEKLTSMVFRLLEGALGLFKYVQMRHIFQYLQALFSPTKQ